TRRPRSGSVVGNVARRTLSPSRHLQDVDGAARARPPHVLREGDAGAGDLPGSGLAAQLFDDLHDLRDPRRADWMPLRLEAPARVGGDAATEGGLAGRGRRAA